jgi:5-methylcytosine-specific restriction endonuclease McrA
VCSDHREAHADHIVPVSQGGERYDVANGQCLCVRCHGRKTRAEQEDTRRAASDPAKLPPTPLEKKLIGVGQISVPSTT